MDHKNLRALMCDKSQLSKIKEATSFLDPNAPLRQRLWHVSNNIFSVPMCKTCSSESVTWSVSGQCYREFCSPKCSQHDAIVRQKVETTCLHKYGAKSNLCTEENKKKQRATNVAKYGVDNFAKTTEFKDQYTATCMGRYGVTNTSKLQTTKDKINETHQGRYGRKRSSQSHIPTSVIEFKNNAELMRHWFTDLQMPVSEIAEVLGVNHSQLCVHFKENLGIDITRHSVSTHERQLGDFLKSLGIQFHSSDRSVISPKELDFYIPSHNIAIEMDGLAWHTELRGKTKDYHLNKTNECRAKGIRLIHILDIEWINRQEIVKSRLRGIFGKNKKIHGRKCTIKPLDSPTATRFFNESHIQGSAGASVYLGLYFNTELVAAMSFGKPRFAKDHKWELIRFANKLGYSVVGGASKLFNYFVNTYHPETVISYCDLRWNTGSVYSALGFKQTKVAGPGFWYTQNYRSLVHRLKLQKYNMSLLLPNFDPAASAWENAKAHGYDRFWDCGNLVFVWSA